MTRADAARVNQCKPESADAVLKELVAEGLLALGERRGRAITYTLAAPGRRILRLVRRVGQVAPPPSDGWWITVKRSPKASITGLLEQVQRARPSRVYRCVGDFDIVAAIPSRSGSVLVDDLMDSLRKAGAKEIAVSREEISTRPSGRLRS